MKNCFLIVNCNDYKSTKHLVDNIKNYRCINKILIVDNNSKSSEKELLSGLEQNNIEVLYLEDNLGYSHAINEGSRYLIEKYKKCNLIVSNSDIVIMDEVDLVKLIDALNLDTIGVVGPQIMELGSFSRGCKLPSPLKDSALNILSRKFTLKNKALLYDNDLYETDYSSVDVLNTCFFLISSELLERINYMDENVFLYYEDYILGKKVKDIGKLLVVVNDVKIKHLYSISVDKIIKEIDKLKLLYRSQFYFHTTYNDTDWFEKLCLRCSAAISVFLTRVIAIVRKL